MTAAKVWDGSQWIVIGGAGPAGPNPAEVRPSQPTAPTTVLWIDTDEVPSSGLWPLPLVNSIPASPYDGQEIYYQDNSALVDGTNTMAQLNIVWHLRYRAAAIGLYKWEFLGGTPIYNSQTGSQTSLTTTATAAQVPVTTPLKGSYNVEWGGNLSVATANQSSYLYLYINGGQGALMAISSTAMFTSVYYPQYSVTSGAPIALDLRALTTSGTGSLGNRWIRVTPLKVG